MREVLKGATSQTIYLVLRSSTTGLGLTAKVFGDVTGSYTRMRAARTGITMATLASASAAWSSGGFILVDDTNCPGLYRFDIPDAAFATGADRVIVSVKVTGAIEEHIEFLLTNWDKQTALSATTIGTVTTYTGDTPQTGDAFARLGAPAGASVSADIVTLDNFIDTEVASILAAVDTEVAAIITTLGTPAGASVSADIAAIEAQTDDIGAAGAGLTAIPWNVAWDAEVQSEVADALGVYDPPTHTELIAEIDAVQADVAGVQSDTNDIQARLPAALTAGGNMKADALALSGDTVAADNAEAFFDGTGYAGTGNVIPSVTTVTGNVNGNVGGNVTGSVGTASDLGVAAKAAVNAEVVDALNVDTYAELAAVPAATATFSQMVRWLFNLSRNKITQTSTTQTLRNDADSGTIGTSSVADDGTTATRGEWA